MHHAWHITEIRNLILARLRPGDTARLGRTCRFISECVLDYLWAELESFDGFLCLLPQHPRDEPLKIEDLERLDFYGRKVRKLKLFTAEEKRKLEVPLSMSVKGEREHGFRFEWSAQPWIDLWEEIAQLRSQTAFMPNLQHLCINNIAAELLLPLIGITGACLESIYIKAIHQPRDLLRRLLENMIDTPRLEYLFVRNGLPDHVPAALIKRSPLITLRLDPTNRYLYGLRNPPIDPCVFTCASIQNLTLGLPYHWHGSETETLGSEKFLPKLRQLRLNVRCSFSYQCHQNCPSCTLRWTGNPKRLQKISKRHDAGSVFDCRYKPPADFIRYLNLPHLELLNIKFNEWVDGALLLDTMKAVVDSCQLDKLGELVLSNGGHVASCSYHPGRDKPEVDAQDIWEMLEMLGPLPNLRVLRIPLACGLLQEFDMDEYRSIANAFPAMQALTVSHRSFASFNQGSYHIYDRTPLRHVAAFCHLFPDLDDVEIGCIDATCLDLEPSSDWTCTSVRRFHVGNWITATETTRTLPKLEWDWRERALQSYFPNAVKSALRLPA